MTCRSVLVGWLCVVMLLFCGASAVGGTYSGGSGAAADPYRINSTDDWSELVNTSGDWAEHFQLTTDLDFKGTAISAVAPTDTTPFTGVFDGNGHVLRNAVINLPDNDYVGVFGCLGTGGEIRNLGVENTAVIGRYRVGSLVGENSGTITACYATDAVSGSYNVGGLVGYSSSGTIASCYATGAVTGTSAVGGLVGYLDSGTITSCYAAGAASGSYNVGGLVGCSSGTITSCYATGAVSGSSSLGGLVGYIDYGVSMSASMSAAGVVSGLAGVSVLAGTDELSAISASFWDMETSGQSASDGGRGLTSAQMKALWIFQYAGWGAYGWVMEEGQYPRLAWEGTGATAIPEPDPHVLAGAGTEADPYRIATAQEFALFSWYLTLYDKHILLTTDPDCAGAALYSIGDVGNPFTGVFDGGGHVIRDAVISRVGSDFVGLFGYVGTGGEIRSLGVENIAVGGRRCVGGLAGGNSGTITSCYATGSVAGTDWGVGGLAGFSDGAITSCYATGAVTGSFSLGGLAGYLSNGTVTSCYATGAVAGAGYDSGGPAGYLESGDIGGLLGYVEASTVTSCYAANTVTSGGYEIGGLVGYLQSGTITYCYATGAVTGTSDAGGLVAYLESGTITSCHATGAVTGTSDVGGLVDYMQSGTITSCYATGTVAGEDFDIGGLVGYLQSGTVTSCCATGAVTGRDFDIGGLVGYLEEGAVKSCYAAGAVTGRDYDIGGLVGYLQSGTMTSCCATGTVKGRDYDIGGLVGYLQDGAIASCYATGAVAGRDFGIGGLAGYLDSGTIASCYAAGAVTGTSAVGGLVGDQSSGTVSASYWDKETSGQVTSAGGDGRTTVEMTYPYAISAYANWDFTDTWAKDTDGRNRGYPYLQGIPLPYFARILAPIHSGTLVKGDSLRLMGSGYANPAIGYFWDFGDGRTCSEQNPGLVSFPTAGVCHMSYAAVIAGEAQPFPDTRTFAVVDDSGAYPDLKVTTLNVPADLAIDQPAAITYTVSNVGDGALTGASWKDAVYLSDDSYLDARDMPLASVAVTTDVAAGGTYQGAVTVTLPPVEEGARYLILSVNDEWRVVERHRLNNEYAASISCVLPEPVANQPYTAAYVAGRVEHYYRVTAPGGQANLRIAVANLPAGFVVLVRHGAFPTGSVYDYRLTGSELLIPAATAGDWYILVFDPSASQAGEYALTWDAEAVSLVSVTPRRHGTDTALDLTLAGAGFVGTLEVELAGAAGTFAADSVKAQSFTQLTANFTAGRIPPGFYTVRVSRGGDSAELANALEVFAGGEAKLETKLVLPGSVGYHGLATIYVEYSNTGDASMPAPLLTLTAEQNGRQGGLLTLEPTRLSTGFWTSAMPQGFSNSVQFLGYGENPGVLMPGESRRVPVYYAGWQREWNFWYPPIEWELGVLRADDTTPANWAEHRDAMRPSHVRADAWEAIWANFTTQAGPTWGSYVAMLNSNAVYLSQQGRRVEDIGQLLSLSLRQADGLSPLPILASSTDAVAPAPGLPIVFQRAYAQPISRRYAVAPLGRGWTHNWQFTLSVQGDGTVEITDQTGTPRIFQPDSRYPGHYLAQPGDQGALLAASQGYLLTEADGLVKGFGTDGRLQYAQDTNGNRITCGYSGGLLTSLVHSSGQSLQIAYDGAGRIIGVTDPCGRQTQFTYDGEHLASAHAYDGRITTYTCSLGQGAAAEHALTEIGLPDGTHRFFTYDSRGRLASTHRDGGAEATTFTYDDTGGRVSATDALSNTSRFYFDNWGRTVRTENPLGSPVHFAFNDAGNLATVTDPEGLTSCFDYDQRGKVIAATNALRQTTRFTYTRTLDRLASVADAKGNVTQYTYDGKGNQTAVTYADGSSERWTYDGYGNPSAWSNRRGRAIAYSYDSSGRVVAKRCADGTQCIYTYDARGNLGRAEDTSGATVLTHDTNDYLTRIDYPGGRSLEFTYDAAGRRASSLDQLGRRLDYHYDAGGRLERMTDETATEIVHYEYDALGRLSRKSMGNGVYTVCGYDAASQLVSLVNHSSDDAVISRFDYTYDRRGRRTAMASHYGTWTYEYDDGGQLTHAVLESSDSAIADQDLTYAYDALGNRVSTLVNGTQEFYNTNALNQYVTTSDHTYTYDADGNLIQESGPDGTTAYTYNDENRLVGVARGGDSWTYTYDALGNRVAEDENGAVTHYVIDPTGLGNVVGEYNASGSLVAHYDHGLGLIDRVSAHGSAAYYTFDALGNVSELTGPGGVSHDSYAYRPFGETIRSAAAAPNPFQYMGQWGVMAGSNGVNYMRARLYDSRIARFLTQDPLGLGSGDANPYRYASSNPISLMDPTGYSDYCSESGAKWTQIFSDAGVDSMARGISKHSDELKDFEELWHAWGVGSESGEWYNGMVGASGWMDVLHDSGVYGLKILLEVRFPRLRFAGQLVDAWDQVTKDIGHWIFSKESPFCGWSRKPVSPPNPPAIPKSGGSTGTTSSIDPNAKIGPAGFGAANYVTAGSLLPYRIKFENLPTATAPAQVVTIRDPLSANLDLSTFELTEVGFGDVRVEVPEGLQYFEKAVPYTYSDGEYDMEIEVHLEAWLENGTLYVNFMSIDPATGLPPASFNIGFLPPENGTGRGQGYVAYVIRPKATLASGTEIRNVAAVQFDFGLSIDTDQVDPLDKSKGTDPSKEALVTVVTEGPVSQVNPLPEVTTTAAFDVSWSGQDIGGAGIASYDVYVEASGGAWQLWKSATTETLATYAGQNGGTYGFYSVATDALGQREDKPARADTVTAVHLDAYTFTYSAGQGGTVDGVTPQTVSYAGNATPVAAVPDVGHYFARWSDGVSTTTRQDTNATGDINVTAEFAINIEDILITTTTLPGDTVGIAYPSTTLGATGGTGALTWSILSGSLPAGLSLVAAAGAITGTPTVAGTSDFTATAADTVGATGTKALSIVINAAPSITTVSLPADTAGIAYNQTLSAAGGTAALSWLLQAGSLPAGLSLNSSTGAITGTPTAMGTSHFTVTATDTVGATGTKALSIVINAAPDITTASLPADTVGIAYNQTLAATGGTGALTWSITSGSLPAGLSPVTSTGAITGTPTTPGTSDFTATATDTVGATGAKALSIVINPAPSITTTNLPDAKLGEFYRQQLSVTGGTPPYTSGKSAGSLPPGLSDPTPSGVISGTPTACGTYDFTVESTDTVGATATRALSINVITPALQVTSPNGGEVWAKGTSHAITWTSTLGGKVKIELYKAGVLKSTVSSSTANPATGSKSWSVPSSVQAGTDYKVRITWLTDARQYDDSNACLTIPPYISVSEPAGGRVWKRGTTQTVKWSSNAGGTVKLELYKGTVLDSVITPSASNSVIGTNTYSWPIPSTQAMSASYKIRISSIESTATYVNSSSFSITGDGTCVTVTSPNGGEFWQVGNTYSVRWTSDCEDGMKIELYKAGKSSKTLTSFTPNTGTYSWPISTSQTLGSDYTVKVSCASNSALTDLSNATFSITIRAVTIGALSMTPTTARPGQGVTVNSIGGTYQAATPTETDRLVLGLRDSSGHWVGGDPVVVFAATPGDTISHPWTGSTPTIGTPTKTGNYYFWALNSAAADDASAIADFKARTATSSVTPNNKWPAMLVVSGQVITVTYPNGGETWTTGSSYTITWTSYVGGNVNVDLYKSSTKVLTIGAGLPNSGTCPWTVPVGFTPSTSYKVKVTSTATSSWYDYGNAYFSIATSGALSPLVSTPLRAPALTGEPASTEPLAKLAAVVAATSNTGMGTGGLVDGDPATSWSTLGTTLPETEYVTVDAGAVSPLCAVGLAPGSDMTLFPTEFKIEVSADGRTWVSVVYAKDFQTTGASLWRFEPTDARYVRISGPGVRNVGDGRYYWQIAGVEVYRLP